MPNWRLMIEIIWNSKADFQTYKINNRAFKCPFVGIAIVRLRSIRGYKIENAQDLRICNKGRFKEIAKANNVQQRPIRMHREHTGTQSNA